MIRHATPNDLPVLVGMMTALAEYERKVDGEAVPDLAVNADEVQRALFGVFRHATAFIAETQSARPVGFALVMVNTSTFLGRPGLHLQHLFVEESYRKHGFGRALLVAVARYARSRNLPHFEWSVLNSNVEGTRFYERLGGRPIAGFQLYQLSGEAMQRLLSTPVEDGG